MTSAKVRVEDNLLWVTHIENDDDLVAVITGMESRALVELEIDGVWGTWQKTRQNPRQATGHALNPQNEARRHWECLRSNGIQSVSIRLAAGAEQRDSN